MSGRSTCHFDYSEKTGDTDKTPFNVLPAITINVTQTSACFGHLNENSDKKIVNCEITGMEMDRSESIDHVLEKDLCNENG